MQTMNTLFGDGPWEIATIKETTDHHTSFKYQLKSATLMISTKMEM